MKLTDWAAQQGISYLTAYRWFKKGTLPVEAYQSESGTIIVKDEFDTDPTTNEKQPNEAISLFFKKTLEFSKNQASIEDFATYIFSTFSLKLLPNSAELGPKYSRQKPKPDDVQKHFQKFIPKGDKPKPNMFVAPPEELDTLVAKANELEVQELVNQIRVNDEGVPAISHAGVEVSASTEMKDLLQEISTAVSSVGIGSVDYSVNPNTNFAGAEGVTFTSALSPHSLNYTGSNFAASLPQRDTYFADSAVKTNGFILRNYPLINTNIKTETESDLNNNILLNKGLSHSLVDKPKRGRPKKNK